MLLTCLKYSLLLDTQGSLEDRTGFPIHNRDDDETALPEMRNAVINT